MSSYVADAPPDAMVAETEELLHDSELAPEVRRRVEALHLRGLFWAGRGREGVAFASELLPSPPLRDLVDVQFLGLWSLLYGESGEQPEEMERWWATFLETAMRLDDDIGVGVAALSIGGMRLDAGRYRDATRLLREAELRQERHDPVGLRVPTVALQVAVAYATGDIEGTLEAYERCSAVARGDRPLPNQLPYLLCAEAWATAADGDPPRAQRLLLDRLPEFMGTRPYAARIAYEAMRLGAPAARVAPVLAELDALSDSTLTAARSAHASARAAADGPALLQAAVALEAAGSRRCACEAAAHAAEVYAAQGRQDSARRAAARSRDLFEENQGGLPPAISGIDEDAVRLTPREAQLVELATRGLTNAEIADRLVLSVRTVESHMYRAMQKLGVSDRRRLADRSGLTPARDG